MAKFQEDFGMMAGLEWCEEDIAKEISSFMGRIICLYSQIVLQPVA
jgi:hypothetical protein